MLRKLLIIINLALFVGFVSCQKEDTTETVLKGSITGKVRLADEFGNILTDYGQVTVSTINNKETATIESGSYLMYGLGDGNYDLTFTKNGYGKYIRFGIPVTNFANTTLSGIDTLGKVSTTIISNLTTVMNAVDSTWTFGCTVAPVPDIDHQRGIRLFFSKNSTVSSVEYDYTPGTKWMATNSSGSINDFATSNFYNNGFNRGDSVYVIAYGESYFANIYIDPVSGDKVFPNVNVENPSNVAIFILP